MKNPRFQLSAIKTFLLVLTVSTILTGCLSPSQVTFQVENKTEENVYNATIKAENKPCNLVSFEEILKPEDKESVTLGVTNLMNDCLPSKSDGSYGIKYMMGNKTYETDFGYYTNGIPLDESFDIKFLDTQKISINGKEVTTKLTDSFSMHRSFPGGKYEGDKSLNTSHPLFGQIKTKGKAFYQNLPHAKTSKRAGDFEVKQKSGGENGDFYLVMKNGEKIYESSKTVFIVEEPFKNIVNKGDEWWMLYDENKFPQTSTSYITTQDVKFHTRLIHNGEEVAVAEAFALHNLNGKIFYFFKQEEDSKIQYYLDGRIYQTSFDDIIHDRCCEPGAFNLQLGTDGRLAFWGVKDGKFSYNEAILPEFTTHPREVIFPKFQGEVTDELSQYPIDGNGNPTHEPMATDVKQLAREKTKDVLQNEILKALDFKFSEIFEGKTTPKENIEIDHSLVTMASDVDLRQFTREKNVFLDNGWEVVNSFSWDAFGVYSWQRVYNKDDIYCLAKAQSFDGKKGNLSLACWDEVKLGNLDKKYTRTSIKTKINKFVPYQFVEVSYLNRSKEKLYYGEAFELRHFVKNKWVEVPFKEGIGFDDVAYKLSQNIEIEKKIKFADYFNDLEAGRYQILRKFFNDKNEEFTVATEFKMPEKNLHPTAKERLENEILINPFLGDSNPKIEKYSFKTNVFGEDMEIKNAYKVSIKDVPRMDFPADNNDFVQQNWHEVSEHSMEFSEIFGWRKFYQKGNSNCLVNFGERPDGSQCYDPKSECIPEADLEITCWDSEEAVEEEIAGNSEIEELEAMTTDELINSIDAQTFAPILLASDHQYNNPEDIFYYIDRIPVLKVLQQRRMTDFDLLQKLKQRVATELSQSKKFIADEPLRKQDDLIAKFLQDFIQYLEKGHPINWEEAVKIINSGDVKDTSQYHSLEVHLELSDGTHYRTTEPKIDAIFDVVDECGEKCKNIQQATE
ncbi:hypothetical protein CSB37_04195 [bacterium DOLZORAL124_38_8]|nr:MAG: hypothetical protein CSB37_04195 [bacterium DOLZORAL124_38_8]